MVAPPDPGDPRRSLQPDAAGSTTGDVRPLVAAPGGGASTLLIAGSVVAAGLALFLVLDGHRRTLEAPAVRATTAESARAAGPPAPPPLTLPVPAATPVAIVAAPLFVPQPPPAPRAPQIVYVPQPAPVAAANPPAMVIPPQPVRGGDGATLVIDTTNADGAPGATPGANGGEETPAANRAGSSFIAATTAAPGARARATMLGQRSTSVLQGTLIPAVLETALDTTRPGLARAIVSRDVRGFDGSRVLIPRGSRLTGEYRSDVVSGQNRALVVWTRLIRPDGAAIAIASPAADTLGRAGVRARVDSHFLARFTGAILQSALAIGVNLASRPNNNGTVVVGLPGSTVGGGSFGQNTQVTPTLKARPGTSISVFVSRDLDFADVEGRQ